jgi:hypothetical protein
MFKIGRESEESLNNPNKKYLNSEEEKLKRLSKNIVVSISYTCSRLLLREYVVKLSKLKP